MTKTILVVEDSASIRAIITMTLQSAGFAVIEADDGNAALSQLERQRVYLIISDLNMPGMDGMNPAHASQKTASDPLPALHHADY